MKNWFKVRKFKTRNKYLFGYENRFFRILRSVEYDFYLYSFYDFTIREYRQLHKGIKLKPLKPIYIVVWSIIFNLLIIPFTIVTFIPFAYLSGMYYFIKGGVNQTGVNFFGWINFIAIIFFLIFELLT